MEFVIWIVAISTAGWLVNNWIRAKHGYSLEDEWGGKTKRADSEEAKALRAENRALNEKVDAMQDRMIVLEKIVTDRGYSLAQEIDALRATDTGAPLNLSKQERV
jgi:hypothetical protein